MTHSKSKGGKIMWKEIKNFEGYEVSTDGEVRNKVTGKLLKPQVDRYGYLFVGLYVNGKQIFKKVHRLVAEAYIPNPDNKPQVNHVNEVKVDNRVNNLSWMTCKENINHGMHNARSGISRSKPIYALYPDGTDEYFSGASVAASELGLNRQNIVHVLKGNLKTSGGLRFAYAEGGN